MYSPISRTYLHDFVLVWSLLVSELELSQSMNCKDPSRKTILVARNPDMIRVCIYMRWCTYYNRASTDRGKAQRKIIDRTDGEQYNRQSEDYRESKLNTESLSKSEDVQIALTPHRNWSVVRTNAQTGLKLKKRCRREPLCHHAGELRVGRNMQNSKLSKGNFFHEQNEYPTPCASCDDAGQG